MDSLLYTSTDKAELNEINKLIKASSADPKYKNISDSYYKKIKKNYIRMNQVNSDLEKVLFCNLAPITEEDEEEFVAINLKKKTIKKLLRNYNESLVKEALYSSFKNSMKEKKTFINEDDWIDEEEMKSLEMLIEDENLDLKEQMKYSVNFTKDQISQLYESFNNDLIGKFQSMSFEIEQIFEELNMRYNFNSDAVYKKYNKYIQSSIKGKQRDYSVYMLKSLQACILSNCIKNYDLLYSNNGKIRMLKEKFISVQTKHNFKIPMKIFSSSCSNKEKEDMMNTINLGISNINLVFSELFKVMELIMIMAEGADRIFSPLLDKLNVNSRRLSSCCKTENSTLNIISSSNCSNSTSCTNCCDKKLSHSNSLDNNDNLSFNQVYSNKQHQIDISIYNIIVDAFVCLINSDQFLKYVLLVVKHKDLKREEISKIEKMFADSDNQQYAVDKLINKEIKEIFENVVLNTNNLSSSKLEIKRPITPCNSEESDYINNELNDKNDKLASINDKKEVCKNNTNSDNKDIKSKRKCSYNTANNNANKEKDNLSCISLESREKKKLKLNFAKQENNSNSSIYNESINENNNKRKNNDDVISGISDLDSLVKYIESENDLKTDKKNKRQNKKKNAKNILISSTRKLRFDSDNSVSNFCNNNIKNNDKYDNNNGNTSMNMNTTKEHSTFNNKSNIYDEDKIKIYDNNSTSFNNKTEKILYDNNNNNNYNDNNLIDNCSNDSKDEEFVDENELRLFQQLLDNHSIHFNIVTKQKLFENLDKEEE